MSKSVLVINTPPCCEDCPCSAIVKAPQKTWEAYCELCEKFNNKIMTKPEWCPLKPMPERKDGTFRWTGFDDVADESYLHGWNACLDELEGK